MRCYRRPTVEEAATIRTAQADAPAADMSVRMDDVSKHFGAFIAVGGESRPEAPELGTLAAVAGMQNA